MRRLLAFLLVTPALALTLATPAAAAVTAPAKPVIADLTRTDGRLTLTWPADDQATSFRIHVGPDAAQLALRTTVTTPTYTDPDISDGLRVYAVEAVNDAGTTTSDPREADLAFRAPAALTGVASAGQTTLTWVEPTGIAPNPRSGYAVFQGASAAALTQVATTTTPTWSGPAPAAGVHAFYAVAAVLSDGAVSPRSSTLDLIGTATQLIVAKDGSLEAVPLAGGTGTSLLNDGLLHPDVAVNPNGTLVAYTSTDGESNRELWVRRTDGSGSAQPIDTSGQFDVGSPAWSPDNNHVAYAREDGSICITGVPVGPAGPGPCIYRPELDGLDEPSWLNGNTLVLTDPRSETAPLVRYSFGGVATPIAGTNGGYTPVVSPDTTQVAFLLPGSEDFSEVIKVINLTTGAVRTLPAPSGLLFSAPTWTRDMSALYVVGYDENSSHIYRIGTTTTTVSGITGDLYGVAISTPDKVAPVNVKLGGIPAVTLNASVTPTFSAGDALNKIGSYELRFRVAAYNRPFSGPNLRYVSRPTAIGVSKGNTYCFTVLAVDRANNRSAPTPEQCVVVPMDDRALTRSSGFALTSNRAYYAGTGVRATAKGQTVSRTGMTGVRQLTVIATACPSCGIVDVLFNGAKIGSFNTISATTVHRKVFTLPAFSARTGTATLRVASSGKLVLIDGLGFRK